MKNKLFAFILIGVIIVTLGVLYGIGMLMQSFPSQAAADSVGAKEISQQIAATGSVHSEQEATLHFQTGGKLIYLPFKQGDTVAQGQTIAQLDTYALQRSLTAALNNYRATRDAFDQTQQNAQTNVLQTQQQSNFPGIQANQTNAINDAVKRILDETQGTLDNSVINVELANYALQLSSLTAPFSGTLLSEDVTTPNVNVTTTTSFTIADPSEKVFRAQVDASDIDFVTNGAKAIIRLDGKTAPIAGTVLTIYPQKQALATGENVYMVDIQSDSLNAGSVFGQNGSVLIQSNVQTKALMVPSWAIVGHNTVWVEEDGRSILKTITTGNVHGNMTEVTNGLSLSDKIILNPKSVVVSRYQLL